MELGANIIGTIGVVCGLAAYFLLQNRTFKATDAGYLWLNLLAPVMIMVSLAVHWNLPAFLIEAAWALITLYGMYKHLYLARRNVGVHDGKQG